MNCRPIAYIGFCADETKRFKYQLGEGWEKGTICYPLAEEGIEENTILEWARDIPLFNSWYKHFKRQGCMMCPMLTRKELAYLALKYKNKFELYFDYIKKYEQKYNTNYWTNYNSETIYNVIINKWIPRLQQEENQIEL